nr:hypothetical protein [Kitasatospora sp. SID7827]
MAGLALGDFRDRARRPVYAVILLAAVGLGCLAVPAADSSWVILDVGGHRGTYNSAYVGTATALAGALWLTVGGFYAVRGAIVRDGTTRVGQVLAATPLRTPGYLFAKFLANLAVLGSMLAVLAGTALVLQLVRGEDRAVHPVALLGPFVLLALPPVALTAALAVLFETVRPLRAGLGNVVWFVVALPAVIGGQSGSAPLGGLGVGQAARSLEAALAARRPPSTEGGFSLGLTQVPHPLDPFRWDGFAATGGFLRDRLLLLLLAAAVALLPALWFRRIAPDPALPLTPARRAADPVPAAPAPAPAPAPAAPPRWTAGPPNGLRPAEARTAGARTAGAFGRLFAGEARILVQGVPRWWWPVAGGLAAVGLAVPLPAATGLLLPLGWLWPVLLWSRLGSQRVEHGLEGLLAAYPAPRRRLLAEWTAGLALTALAGLAPLLRLLVAGDGPGLAHWAAGALLVPSLALALGTLSRGHRLFQALYLPLWYLLVNRVAALDFMGAVRTAGRPAGPHPLLVTALAAALLAASFAVAAARRGVKE